MENDPQRSILVWDVEGKKEILDARITPPSYQSPDVALAPDGSLMAAAFGDGPIEVWDVKAGKLHAMSLLISADGTTVKSSDLWDADFEYGAERTINEDNAIELKSIAIGHIAAHAHLLKQHKYIDNEKFEYDVTFSTPVADE